METISRKGIPYKSNENKQTTNVMIRLTESKRKFLEVMLLRIIKR
jgi:hypothetical protein